MSKAVRCSKQRHCVVPIVRLKQCSPSADTRSLMTVPTHNILYACFPSFNFSVSSRWWFTFDGRYSGDGGTAQTLSPGQIVDTMTL